jgi:hypothetical protein
MKKFFLYLLIAWVAILILGNLKCTAQINHDKHNYAVFGCNVGYNAKVERPEAGAQLGYRLKNFYLSSNMIVTTSFNALSPVLFPFNLGYNIGSFQPFISYGYHLIGKEAETRFKGNPDAISAWKPGFGLSFYFKQFPLSITIQRQGKINIASIGCYKSF